MSKLNTLYKFVRHPKNQGKTAYLIDNSRVTIAQNSAGILVFLRHLPDVGWRVCSSLYQREFLEAVSVL